MAPRYNPPPTWPAPPAEWTPPPGWRPDPAWGPVPDGWQLWVNDVAHGGTGVDRVRQRRQSRAVWIAVALGGVAAITTLVAVAVGLANGSESDSDVPTVSEWAAERRAERAAQASDEDRRQTEERAAAEAAEEASLAAAQDAEREAEDEAARVAAEEAARAEEADLSNPENYEPINDRGWAQVERDPDSHIGDRYVIYGHVYQFDANTGPASFMALTSGEPKSGWWDYDIDTLVDGISAETVEDVVEGDLVTMYVEVLGSRTYTTLIGGFNTAPHVQVNALSVDGSV